MILRICILLGCLALLAPWQSLNAMAEYMSKEAAYDLLQSNRDEKVLALAKGDREVLLATLELERERVDAALAWLSDDVVQSNSLAAFIKGEAFRRKSLAAALRAGSYAHAAHDDIKKLSKAEFTPALQEAKKRLQAFMRIDTAVLEPEKKQASHALNDAMRASVVSAVQAWLKDWQSLNHKAYMSHYAANFQTDQYDYQSWSRHKQRINQKKAFIHIQISDVTIVADAKMAGDAVIVSFKQRYQSSNYNSNDDKQLYMWRSGAGAPWLIMDEGRRVYPARFHANEAPPSKSVASGWVINIGSFQRLKNAEDMVAEIKRRHGFQAFVVSAHVADQKRYRVRSGVYDKQSLARDVMLDICVKLAIAGCWLEKNR